MREAAIIALRSEFAHRIEEDAQYSLRNRARDLGESHSTLGRWFDPGYKIKMQLHQIKKIRDFVRPVLRDYLDWRISPTPENDLFAQLRELRDKPAPAPVLPRPQPDVVGMLRRKVAEYKSNIASLEQAIEVLEGGAQ